VDPSDVPEDLKHTPLEDEHRRLGAKLAPFAGWLMPIEYEGALAEHRAVRERVGLFDLTHLGKVDVTGPGALGMLQRMVSNDLSKVAVGEALYNLVLNDGGGVIEDLIVYRMERERFFVVPNASNAPRVLRMLEEERADEPLHLMYHQDWCFLAVQGPESVHVMARLFPEAGDLSFMQCAGSEYHRRPVIVTRSGYTGEVGFELFTYQDIALELWHELTEAMRPFGGLPCGLAARDVLRLEMGYPLYGQDLFERRPPWRPAWMGGGARQGGFRGGGGPPEGRGLPSRLLGLLMEDRRHIPRAHYPAFSGIGRSARSRAGHSPAAPEGSLAYLWPGDVVGSGRVRWMSGAEGRDVVRPPFVDRSGRHSTWSLRSRGDRDPLTGHANEISIAASPKACGRSTVEHLSAFRPSCRTATTT
jgi:aminomethyltransferase